MTKLIEGADGAPLFIQSVQHFEGIQRTKVTFFNGLTIDMPRRAYNTLFGPVATQRERDQAVMYWRTGSRMMGERYGQTLTLEEVSEAYREVKSQALAFTSPPAEPKPSPYRYC